MNIKAGVYTQINYEFLWKIVSLQITGKVPVNILLHGYKIFLILFAIWYPKI